MALFNLDALDEKRIALKQAFADAIKAGDADKAAEAFNSYTQAISEEVMSYAASVEQNADRGVLAARNVRQLTSAEMSYYQKFITAAKSPSPQQAISNIDVAMPETIIDDALTDLKTEHPLLSEIDFINTTAITKWIYNKQGQQTAVWGELGTAITQELSGNIGSISTTLCKLTAFMYISNDLLDLGPNWIDTYVRTVLSEAVSVSSEIAIVDGTGNDQPIGMTRDVSDNVVVTGGVYPRKTAIAMSEITPTAYGALLSQLATSPNGNKRVITGLIMLVNPSDYFSIVMPATTLLTPSGAYINNVMPYPTKIIQSVGVPSGHAVLGLGKRYFMGVGMSKKGKIEADGSYKFLEDLMTYTIKMYANGRPKDNNAFLYLDISALQPVYPTVNTIPRTSIASVAVSDITAPATGGTPDTTASVTCSPASAATVSTVTWSPTATTFAAETEYTATVVLTAATGSGFSNNTTVTIGGNAPTSKAISANGAVMTITYKYPATEAGE